jgi:hypothetical protein
MSKDTKHIRNRDAWKARALAYERAIRLTLKEQALRDNATGGTIRTGRNRIEIVDTKT